MSICDKPESVAIASNESLGGWTKTVTDPPTRARAQQADATEG